MALPIATIDNILNNGGDMKFQRTTTSSAGKPFGEKGDVAMRFWPSYWNCTAAVNLTDITPAGDCGGRSEHQRGECRIRGGLGA